MKTMKKYFKVVFCFLAFAICSLFMAFAPTMAAVSASSVALTEYKNALSAIKMKKSIDASEGLKIPLLEANIFGKADLNEYSIIVTDAAGTTGIQQKYYPYYRFSDGRSEFGQYGNADRKSAKFILIFVL